MRLKTRFTLAKTTPMETPGFSPLKGFRLGLILLVCGHPAICPSSLATAFVPKDDQTVLERLRSTAAPDALTVELRSLRRELSAEPDRLDLALRAARLYVGKNRSESDPRYLGYAQAVLARWWDLPQPPPPVLVMRATIRQSRHDFEGAENDLRQALAADRRNPQAWLTLATIQQVRGDYQEARKAALAVFRSADELVAVTCVALITSLNGEAAKSYALLSQAVEHNPRADVSVRLWSITGLAEIGARMGRIQEAETHYHQALALGPSDTYLLGSYADFLMDQGRPQEALPLLKEHTRADNLLLRLALAESQVRPQPASLAEHIRSLRDRFEAAKLRGDFVHQREEARFSLHLLHQPLEALRLATANWKVQREPADVRILLEAASAARDPAAAQPVVEWLRERHVEDVELAKLGASQQ